MFIFALGSFTVAVLAITHIIITKTNNKKTLFKMAYYDELTGISNLNKFKYDVRNLMQKVKRENYAFVRFDIKEFKIINDMFGYENGDRVLLDIVKSVKGNIKDSELFARVSNDNFILFMEYEDEQHLTGQTKSIVADFEKLNSFDNTAYNISFSAGAYHIRKDDKAGEISAMIDKATMAHKLAKRMESNSVVEYNDEIRDQALFTKELENGMAKAMEKEEFKVYLQPKYSLENEQIIGVEALVRWQTEEGKMIFPDSFIPLFERNGFVLKLDMYMLEKACIQLRKWIDSGITPVPISVNFSRNHYKNEQFVKNVIEVVKKYNIPPNLIELEFTESTMIANEKRLFDIMQQLHNEGVIISMDDFGVGYSSLGILKNLPVDIIKIDKSFFDDSSDGERAEAVVASVIAMAKQLNIFTVAEGIETKENVDLLSRLGCDAVQGYYFARPMPIEEFDKIIRKL